jgi:hypothetical protein
VCTKRDRRLSTVLVRSQDKRLEEMTGTGRQGWAEFFSPPRRFKDLVWGTWSLFPGDTGPSRSLPTRTAFSGIAFMGEGLAYFQSGWILGMPLDLLLSLCLQPPAHSPSPN